MRTARLAHPLALDTCLAEFEILKHGLDTESQCQWYIHAGIDLVESVIVSVVRSGRLGIYGLDSLNQGHCH